MNAENKGIMIRAYEIYEEHGFQDGNDFKDWLEAERQAGEKATVRRENRIEKAAILRDDRMDKASIQREDKLKNILWGVIAILGLIVAILLFTLFQKDRAMDLSAKSLSDLKVMLMVMDPKLDEAVVAFGDTHFDFAESTLTPAAKTLLDNDVQVLKDNPSMHVRMAGYTSATGTEAVNQKLSVERAKTVRNYLIERGVAADRITVIGYGRTKPALYEVKPGNVNSAEAKANMRVLFEIIVK